MQNKAKKIADPVKPSRHNSMFILQGIVLGVVIASWAIWSSWTTNPTVPHVVEENFRKVDSPEIRALQALYDKLRPIEEKFKLHRFGFSNITKAEISMNPTILLLGPYSTGKTTFIKHMIGMDYPGIHIGPEPTTDKFTAVLYGDDNRTISGNVLLGIEELPFGSLGKFGDSFIDKFSAAVVSAPPLKNFHFIDTPGVLSGKKQSVQRGYAFPEVAAWFAAHADLILLFFDCDKLDISDEFLAVLDAIAPYENFISTVLNKVNNVDQNELMRLYGYFTRSLATAFKSSVEGPRIYVGSFSDKPPSGHADHTSTYFESERAALMSKFNRLHNDSAMRKLSKMLKRIREVHAIVATITYMQSHKSFWNDLTSNMPKLYADVREAASVEIFESDFPKEEDFKATLKRTDLSTFPTDGQRELKTLQDLLRKDLPTLSKMLNRLATDPEKDKSTPPGPERGN